MAARILIVDDESAIRQMLSFALAGDGYACSEAGDIDEAQQVVAARRPDLILLDWMLPGISGVDYARRLKRDPRTGDIPVILLTARGEEADKVRGFRFGADDYVTKPFGLMELLARVDALLRRARRGGAGDGRRDLGFGDVVVDEATRSVRRAGGDVALRPKEFDLLCALLRRQGELATRMELLREVWGYDDSVMSRTVDTHIAELRRKLEADPASPRHILTVLKVGYRLQR